MNSILLLTAALAGSLYLQAQVVTKKFDSRHMKDLLNSRLVLVLSGENPYDHNLIEAAKKYWKHNELETIVSENLDMVIWDKSKAFLVPITVKVTFSDDNGASGYEKNKSYLAILNGGWKS